MVGKKCDVQYNKFICDFYRELNKKNTKYSNLIFLCIGTDRIIGDCFGPIVGGKLQKNIHQLKLPSNIYGTLDNPISALNLEETTNKIKIEYKDPYIIAIDAALSTEDNVGKIFICDNYLEAGKGIKEKGIRVGNISIRAIIGKKENTSRKNMDILQNTSLNMVIKLAEIVSNGIIEVIQNI